MSFTHAANPAPDVAPDTEHGGSRVPQAPLAAEHLDGVHGHPPEGPERPPSPPPSLAPAAGGGNLGYRDTAGLGLAIINPLIYGVTLDGLDDAPAQEAFLEAVSAGHELVSFDQRGVGASTSAGVSESWDQRATDLWTVADAAGIERAVLYGVGDAGHTIAHAALQQPERVLGLIFNRVPPCFSAAPGDQAGVQAQTVAGWFATDAAHPVGRPLALMETIGIAPADAGPLAAVWQSTGTPEAMQAEATLLREADLRPLLPAISAPALVIAPKSRPVAGVWAKILGDGLPNARVVRPESGGEALGAIHAFLTVRGAEVGRLASTLPANLSSTLSDSQRAVAAVRRIVVPVDTDVDTGRAVELACRLGQAQRAEIVLVHVVAVPHVLPLDHPLPEAMLRAERALALGQAIVAEHDLLTRKRILRDRSVGGAVVRFAREERADLIVMEAGGDARSAEGPPGRTAQEILRRASCEVLLDRGPLRT